MQYKTISFRILAAHDGRGWGSITVGFTCSVCGRDFSEYTGLQLHKHRAHSELFFDEKLAKLDLSKNTEVDR